MADSESRAETALACLAIALSVLFLFEGAKLKPGVFEPIGPGAVPMGVAVVTIVLSLLVLLARWRKPFAESAAEAALPDDAPQAEKWGLLAAVAALTIVYTAVLHSGVARYGVVTVGYLLLTFLVVSGSVRRDLRWSVVLALVFGLGLDYVFRHLLVADLP
jgi:Na+-transporting methylmalonyl-CoA/oxaloacetate decarboxylase gamma subunit